MGTSAFRIRFVGIGLALLMLAPGLALGGRVAAANMACEDASNLCLVPASGAKWEAGKTTLPKDRKKRVDNGGSLSLSIDGGRGSLFVNGRYAGTAPLSGISVPAGRNDVQVRDGATVLSQGVLTVPKGGSLSITVNHP